MWAYNKATAGTGGLAAVLGSSLPGLREASAQLLGSLVLPWPSPAFTAALEGIATFLIEASTNAHTVGNRNLPSIALHWNDLTCNAILTSHPSQELNVGFYSRACDAEGSSPVRPVFSDCDCLWDFNLVYCRKPLQTSCQVYQRSCMLVSNNLFDALLIIFCPPHASPSPSHATRLCC